MLPPIKTNNGLLSIKPIDPSYNSMTSSPDKIFASQPGN